MNGVHPPKLFLDTNHLIEIAKLRNGGAVRENDRSSYLFIDDCIRNHHFGLIFNAAAPLEWVDGNATLESAKEIAAVVDSAQLQYEMEKDSFVFLYEVQAELRGINPGVQLPEFEILLPRTLGKEARRALSVILNQVPGFLDDGERVPGGTELPNEIPFATASEHVERAFKLKIERPSVFRERVEGHKAAYLQDVNTFGQRSDKTINSADQINWMKRFLHVDRILAVLAPHIDIDNLLGRVDVTKCPAVNLFLRAHEERIRACNTPRDNDVDDWMFVPIVPYADLVLTERNLCHFIRQAVPSLASRVTHNPNTAAEILRQWT